VGKDKINEETIEFLLPYMELENFTSQVRWPTLIKDGGKSPLDCLTTSEG
jgi:hypothetical protein